MGKMVSINRNIQRPAYEGTANKWGLEFDDIAQKLLSEKTLQKGDVCCALSVSVPTRR